MNEHAADLGAFLTLDDRGKLLPGYLSQLVLALAAEQQGMTEELAASAAASTTSRTSWPPSSPMRAASIVEPLQISDLVEDALRMNGEALVRHQVTVVKEFAPSRCCRWTGHRCC